MFSYYVIHQDGRGVYDYGRLNSLADFSFTVLVKLYNLFVDAISTEKRNFNLKKKTKKKKKRKRDSKDFQINGMSEHFGVAVRAIHRLIGGDQVKYYTDR